MPTLTASVNGTRLAQVRTDGYDVMSVSVLGTCIDEEVAELMMTGGKYPKDGESVYLTWVHAHLLKAGDLVEVTIQEDGVTSHSGKTIDELFPNEDEPVEEMDFFNPTSEHFAELRARPRLREVFKFQLETDRGTSYSGKTGKDVHGFSFTVLWNSHRPERASLSLHSYTIESMELKQSGQDHWHEYIEPHTVVRFSVDA